MCILQAFRCFDRRCRIDSRPCRSIAIVSKANFAFVQTRRSLWLRHSRHLCRNAHLTTIHFITFIYLFYFYLSIVLDVSCIVGRRLGRSSHVVHATDWQRWHRHRSRRQCASSCRTSQRARRYARSTQLTASALSAKWNESAQARQHRGSNQSSGSLSLTDDNSSEPGREHLASRASRSRRPRRRL
jgi:hypothetical protein